MALHDIIKKDSKFSTVLLAALIGAAVVFYFLMSYFTSPQLDDLHYGYPYRHWLLGEGDFPGFEPWWRTIKAHFLGINGRFGDKLLIGFLLLPKWISASLATVSTVGFMVMAAYLATGSLRKFPWLATTVIIALILCLPWYDTMFLGCMTVNYIMATFWGLAALCLYFRRTTFSDKHRTLKLAGAFIVGFFAGSWHECFTFIIAPGLLLYPLFVKKLSKPQISVLAGGILGGIFIVSNPGFWMRYNDQMHIVNMKNASMIFYYANFSLIYLVAYPLFMAIKRLRRRYSRSEKGLMLTCFIALILNVVIYLSNLSLPRVPWFGMTLGIVGLGLILTPFRAGKKLAYISKTVVSCGVIFCVAHFCVAAATQFKVDKEYKEVIALYRASTDGTVFYTINSPYDTPWIALSRPFYDQFCYWHTDAGTDTFYKKAHVYLQLVPEALKEFSTDEAKLVNARQGIYLYKGYCVVDADKTPYKRWRTLKITSAEGSNSTNTLLCHKFHSADGHLWYYIQTDGKIASDEISKDADPISM